MKNKIKYALTFLWTSFLSFSFPLTLGMIFMCITGHSKGYDYDLGSEKGISIMCGVIGLVIWSALSIPPYIYIFKRTKEKKKAYALFLLIYFVLLFLLSIYLIGGWREFARFFNL